MATVITYKNETLATLSDETKILATAGKYMEDNVTIADNLPSVAIVEEHWQTGGGITVDVNTYGNTPLTVTDTFDENGGTIRAIESDIEINYEAGEAIPTESVQIISPSAGYDALAEVKVNAISSTYVGTEVPRQSATTYTPTTTDQTIPAGTYLEEDQIIEGDENLVPSKIVMGNEIFGVRGTGGGYTPDEIAVHGYGFTASDTVILSTATYIHPYTFFEAGMGAISAPNVTRFTEGHAGTGSYVFAYCSNLTSVNLPNLTAVGSGGYQFYKCTSLPLIHLPNAGGQHMCEGDTALQTAVLSGSTVMNSFTFLGCTALEIVDLKTSKLSNGEFKNCTHLTTIILRNASVVTQTSAPFNSSNGAFVGTPFASGGSGGTIYVPQALLETYPSATNWSAINTLGTVTWMPIEGSVYETKYADGTDI